MQAQVRQALDDFFRDSEQKAYLMAITLTHDHHDALELVQESMLKLVQKYRHRDPQEWGPLFYRILQNAIRDWFRKQKFRQILTGLMPWQADNASGEKLAPSAQDQVQRDDELTRIVAALNQLPLRQRQTFLMRAWQEFSTRETAFALSISENSVKTHYARATQNLRQILGEDDG
ncbi:MAG: sigma-70 family RNA polymerase sigma factor [Gammaproteobacteria bacterium]|nr:sigma-70 family RNA polymerase sigma factor [Gammaproteobacteria bacterium]MDH3449678.1 sigma-70 family RNA polymerase sigma factor [Gammaproteobacteria bacterium]